MLFCYLSTPPSFWYPLQWFWVSNTRLGMNLQILNKAHCLSKSLWFILFKPCQPFASFSCEINVIHQSPLRLNISETVSPGCSRTHLPCLCSSSPRSRLAIKSSFDNKVSSSLVATSFLHISIVSSSIPHHWKSFPM